MNPVRNHSAMVTKFMNYQNFNPANIKWSSMPYYF